MLAGRLGMNHVYGPATTRLFDAEWANRQAVAFMDFAEGPAILSRFPIVRSEVHKLRSEGLPEAGSVFGYVDFAAIGLVGHPNHGVERQRSVRGSKRLVRIEDLTAGRFSSVIRLRIIRSKAFQIRRDDRRR